MNHGATNTRNTNAARARLVRAVAVLAAACGMALAGPLSAQAEPDEPPDGVLVEPTFGSPSELPKLPYPPLDVPRLMTLPGTPTSLVESAHASGDAAGTATMRDPARIPRADPTERTGGINADLLGSRPLGGSAFGGTGGDIIPHTDDKATAGTRA